MTCPSGRLRATILETRRSRSKPDRGLVRTRAELLNQHDQIALSLVAINLIRLRNPDRPIGALRPAARVAGAGGPAPYNALHS